MSMLEGSESVRKTVFGVLKLWNAIIVIDHWSAITRAHLYELGDVDFIPERILVMVV